MAVYVDGLQKVTPSRKWRYSQACHMTADTPEELAAMAYRMGLSVQWLQHEGRCTEHYDLTPGMRAIAVRIGAVEQTRREGAQRAMRCLDARRNEIKAPVGDDEATHG